MVSNLNAPANCLKYKCQPTVAGCRFNVTWVTEVDLAALALCPFLPHSQCRAPAAAPAAAVADAG